MLPSAAAFQRVAFPVPEPFEGWRRIAPVDCVGLPWISQHYIAELAELARECGITVEAGTTLTAQYRRVEGEWFPIPETIAASLPG